MDRGGVLPIGDFVTRASLTWNKQLEVYAWLWLFFPLATLLGAVGAFVFRCSGLRHAAGEADAEAEDQKPSLPSSAEPFDNSTHKDGIVKLPDNASANAEDTDSDAGAWSTYAPIFWCCTQPRGSGDKPPPGHALATAGAGKGSRAGKAAEGLGGGPGASVWHGGLERRLRSIVAAGIPEERAGEVEKLALRVRANGHEPLSDPATLWRFLSAREWDADAATAMYDDAIAWRATFSIRSAMEAHGEGEKYHADGSRATRDPTRWDWARRPVSPEAAFAQRFGFFGRLSSCVAPADEAPIAIWRVGACDLTGYIREDIVGVLTRAFAAHLEDLLQSGRAASQRNRRIVRCRLIIDAHGLSLTALRHLGKLKGFMALGKMYFPEVTASVTVVRAPRAFTAVYGAVQPFLTPVMRRKVCILGQEFDAGLREHAGLSRDSLPTFLGGQAPDDDICEAAVVPSGAGKQLGFL